MSQLSGTTQAVARASAGARLDQIADLFSAISTYTSRAQVDNFIRLLYGRLHQAAGGMLDDDQAELLQKMAQRHVEKLNDAREKRLPPVTKSWFPVRAKSNKTRDEAATGQRDPARWARKQRLGGLASLPPTEEYEGITEGERAVLYIIAADVRETGSCQCTVAEIADRAGVGKTTARNAIRKARDRGMLKVTHRPQWRSKWLSNIITIACKTWLNWLKKFRPNLGFKFKGVKKPASTDTYGFKDIKGQPSVQPEGGPSGRFQRFASRKPPSD
ncbi:hypothetical protein RMS29_028465 (plasmid) [Agrobacterium rosae]|uniref:Uncharacterized protein n=1 Tax=Agrobacterium rosae TaxID=1972867 RepID=A0ABU4W543_9HYPH|nr:hypothetical protein [Agrobacterium rosae]MDX8332871.1 hypothetical protein [Agrobacterium rosae]